MSLLTQVSKGIQHKANITFLMGPNGVGKSTYVSQAPSVIFADIEHGTANLDVTRSGDINTYSDFKNLLTELFTAKHDYKTLGVDSLEALETLIHAHVCKEGDVESIEKYGGGFGKGYVRARELGSEFLSQLRKLANEKGMSTIIIGHTQVKPHTDPTENTTYDRYVPRANDKLASMVKDQADNVFFATYKVVTKTLETNKDKSKAYSTGERVMFTEWRASHDGKNRFNLPYELPLSYEAYSDALNANRGLTPSALKDSIKGLLAAVKSEDIRAKASAALKDAGENVTKLNVIKDRLTKVANT